MSIEEWKVLGFCLTVSGAVIAAYIEWFLNG
jgi:hypothetical protein